MQRKRRSLGVKIRIQELKDEMRAEKMEVGRVSHVLENIRGE